MHIVKKTTDNPIQQVLCNNDPLFQPDRTLISHIHTIIFNEHFQGKKRTV